MTILPTSQPNSDPAMKPRRPLAGLLTAFGISLCLLAGPAGAAPLVTTAQSGPFTPSTASDEIAFAADVSGSDLLHGLVGSGGTWLGNGSSPNGLNDGVHGGDFDTNGITALTGAAWAADGSASFRDFSLGAGAHGQGFEITGIQSIAAWQGAGFQNQKYEVYVRRIGETDFPAAPLLTVDFQPSTSAAASNAQGGASKVNVTDDTGVLASGVVAIRFQFLDTLSNNAGGAVMREIDVSGMASPGTPDPDPPTLAPLNPLAPADGATGVLIARNLVATFSEPIALGTGSITIKNLSAATQTVISLPDARVSASGAVLTIDPGPDLATTADHAVQIAAGAVTDLSGNPFAGVSDDSTWNFRTGTSPLRIMCLGDSITAGYTDNPSWANHPFKFGYRSGLHTLLTQAGYTFLFVGGSTEPWTGISGDPTLGGTYTPAFDLRALGQDGHRGYGGKAANYLNPNILTWLASDNPDVILLKIGTNSQDQAGLNTLVDTITTARPATHLILAQIMPRFSYHQGTVDYNSYIRNTLVPAYQAQGKKVTLVDQYAPFLTNPAVLTSIDTSLFSNGINHPDNDGYDKMARVWFDGIEALGIGPATFDAWISDPDFGIAPGQRGLDDDADGDGIDNGVENHFGTHPGEFSQGLVAGSTNGSTFIFTHPLNTVPAADLSAAYRWSKDLSTFTPDGTPFEGSTVRFTRSPAAEGWVTVTATVTGTALEKLFVEVRVSRE
jgi:lysophospholipase L1-like esterase